MLTSRQKIILSKLLESDQFMTIDVLAKWLTISGRTVRYDLDAIDASMEDIGVIITRMPGKGVKLRVSENKRPAVIAMLDEKQMMTDKNAQRLMMSLFVTLTGTFTIQDVADEFSLSRSSVQKYLVDVEEWLDHFDLQITKQAWKGLQVIGTERSIRLALYQMLEEKDTDLLKVQTWLNMDRKDFELMKTWLAFVQTERGIHYSESTVDVFYLFLFWWKQQIAMNHYVFVPKNNRHKRHFHLGVIESFIQEHVKDDRSILHECAFLDDLFDQAKIVSYKKGTPHLRNYEREIQFCKQLLSQVSTILHTDLLADEKLMNDLTHHVKAAFMRISQGVEVDNPYTEEIKVRYRAIYEMVFQMTYDMGFEMVASEVAYITMHISAAYERNRSRKFLPTVIVVCSSGLAASSILTSKLEQIEPGFHLINVVRTQDLERMLDETNPDFVLTTQDIQMPEWQQTKCFRVSPLLSDNDKRLIQHEAHKIINRQQLASFNELYGKASLVEPSLFDETIHTAQTQDWREAITLAAQPLLEAGYIEQGYIQEMIMSVERNGTYMVFLPNVAFVHARPEYVIKEGISLTVLDQQIEFGDLNPERVDMMIVLAIKEVHNQDFMQLFHYLEHQASRDQLLQKWNRRKDAAE
ncbi:PTS sugar transporter subunit IIA [Alkalihalobacillus sp. LMS6]|uniref:BglG family transcription antiterminator n=1 Tax=Bacillaceae TaxID=186817 RepID=UPI000C06973D|nr:MULTISPECIES: PTS sugar transporter subunit IIA [Bacillaceae]UTR07029.1 PTS sugar transporter subunit IIA [Alkalihalobacillus sp. LMS6]